MKIRERVKEYFLIKIAENNSGDSACRKTLPTVGIFGKLNNKRKRHYKLRACESCKVIPLGLQV